MQKGQYIRLFLSTAANPTKVIAASKEMSLHLSASLEESSTKDTTGDYLEQEVTGQQYDISFRALILTDDDALGGNTANTLDDMIPFVDDTPIYWKIAIVKGTNNRTADVELFSGQAKLTSLRMDGPNRQNASYSGTLTGYGAISVAADPA